MKPKQLLPVLLIILAPAIVSAQDNKKTNSFYQKGNNEFMLTRNFHYSNFTSYDEDGTKVGRSNDLGFNGEWNHFVADHFAIGAGLRASWSGDHPEFSQYDYLSRSWAFRANFTYADRIGDNFNWYGRLSVGYGMDKDIEKNGSQTNTDKSDFFDIKAKLAAPINLGGSNTYIVPYIAYDYNKYNYDGSTENTNGIKIGLNFETYLGCDEIKCDCKNGFSFSKDMYQQGRSYIGYYSKGMFDISSTKVKYDALPNNDYQYNNSDGHLKLEYSYYIIDNLAIGADLGFSTQVEKEKDSDFKSTGTGFDINPIITYNFPIAGLGNNLFIQGYAGVGSDTYKTTYNNNTNTLKYSNSTYGADIGYNSFFSNRLSLTPKVGYEWNTSKNKDTDVKQKQRGIYLAAGVQYHF